MSLRVFLIAVGMVVFSVTAMGAGARATYGAQTTADEPQYLLTALSIFEDGDLDIADERYSGAYREFHEAPLPVQTELRDDGSRISPHNPLLPVMLALPMGLGGWVAAKLTMAAIAGCLAALLVWVGVRRFGVRPTIMAPIVLLFSLSPPLAVYATQIYPELPAALAVTVAIAAITGPPSRSSAVLWLAAVVALPWLAVKYVPVAAVLAIVGLLRTAPSRRARAAAVLVAAGAAYIAFDLAVYGGLTPYASGDHFAATGELGAVGASPDYPARSQRLVGLLVDRGFGLAAWQPAYLLAVPALAWTARRRWPGRRLVAPVVVAGWLVATFVAQTMHGWWWPGRQVVVILPAVVLAIASWVQSSFPRSALTGAVGLTGILAFGMLAWEASVGRLTLIVDFTSTGDPIYRIWSTVLPDYLEPTSVTWALHVVWLGVLVSLAWWGWTSERHCDIPQRDLVTLNKSISFT